MAWHYATDDLARKARSITASLASASAHGNADAFRVARAEMAALRIESTIRSEAGYLDEGRLNRLADMMFEVEEK